MKIPAVFISYRIDDALSYANSLCLSLEKSLGDGNTFHDKSSLKPGMRWPDELEEKVRSARVVLVLIADQDKWLGKSDAGNRMDKPEDWVRKEVEAAVSDNTKLVIPVLINDARLPSKDVLPDSMHDLLNRQHKTVRVAHWNEDMVPLIKIVSDFLGISKNAEPGLSEIERKGVEQRLLFATQKLNEYEYELLLESEPGRKLAYNHEVKKLRDIIAELNAKLDK